MMETEMYQEVFVGRASYINQIIEFLKPLEENNRTSNLPKTITIQGSGGIGKTKLLGKIKEEISRQLNYNTSQIIDLKATHHRSPLSLLQSIASSLEQKDLTENSDTRFSPFFEALREYNAARAQEKFALYNPTIEAFRDCCEELAKENQQVLLLDTFESVQDIEICKWIVDLIPSLGKGFITIVAGRNYVNLHGVENLPIHLEKLSIDEVDELARLLFSRRGVGEDYDLSLEAVQKIAYQTDGRPILVTLAIEWLLENIDIDLIVSIPKERFEESVVRYLRDLSNNEDIVVIMMATVDRRLTPDIISIITKWDIQQSIEIATTLSRFSFVKLLENKLPSENVLTLHDEMLRLVRTYVDFPASTKSKWLADVVKEYYDERIKATLDAQPYQVLVAEKLHYLLRSSPEDAIAFFDHQFQQAVDNYEFDFCKLLLAEVEDSSLNLDQRHQTIVRLNYAEMLVRAYQPFDAKTIFDDLILSFDVEQDTSYFSRAISGLGGCISNGSTVIDTNISEAIRLLESGLQICIDRELQERSAIILHQLGYCYDILGYNNRTLHYYQESNQVAREVANEKLIAINLDEMGKLRLKRYEVGEAMELFQESLEIKKRNDDTSGLAASYHLLGNAYRDFGDFETALRWYDYAEKARLQVSDNLGLCQLYADINWLYLLSKDWDKTLEYLDKCYYEYAVPFSFGREMAEAEHNYYHVLLETEGVDSALPWIEKSFESAVKYSNTLIILDAALHLIETAYERRDYSKIPLYYEVMEELDQKGCGYRIFKGRATNVLGDIAFDEDRYQEAVDHWREGYTIIAIHGRSRSSVLNFNYYLKSRHQKLTRALEACGEATIGQFRKHWEETKLAQVDSESLAKEYPGMLGLCLCAMGNVHYQGGRWHDATSCWFNGLMNIAIHCALKTRPDENLGFEEFVVDYQPQIGDSLEKLRASNEDFDHFWREGFDLNHTYNVSSSELWRVSELLNQISKLFHQPAE